MTDREREKDFIKDRKEIKIDYYPLLGSSVGRAQALGSRAARVAFQMYPVEGFFVVLRETPRLASICSHLFIFVCIKINRFGFLFRTRRRALPLAFLDVFKARSNFYGLCPVRL